MERFQWRKGVALMAQFADYAKYLTETTNRRHTKPATSCFHSNSFLLSFKQTFRTKQDLHILSQRAVRICAKGLFNSSVIHGYEARKISKGQTKMPRFMRSFIHYS